MTSITQTIPSFTGGISQQPDELVLPGQVKELLNGIPDITDGLVKRPGSKYHTHFPSSSNAGTWFNYYRDENEGAYIGLVQRNGKVRIWHANDVYDSNGTKTDSAGDVALSETSAIPYLVHSNDQDLKFLTIADTTFVTNSTQEVKRLGTFSDSRGESIGQNSRKHVAYVELRRLAHGREYSFDVATPTCAEHPLGNANESTGQPGQGRVTQATLKAVSYPTISRGTAGSTQSYQGIDPSLQYAGSEVLPVLGGSGTGMVVRLTVTGQIAVSKDVAGDIDGDDYVGIYSKEIEILHGGRGYKTSDTNYGSNHPLRVRVMMHGVEYGINIVQVRQINVKADIGSFRPEPTSFDANTNISADTILSQATASDIGLPTVEKIGNGLFLASDNEFVVSTTEPDLWRITTNEINDPTELPRQCKHGMVVKVLNSSDSQEDDYFLKFIGSGDDDGTPGADGPGRWEETIAPDVPFRIDANTMPHIIQRQANGSFTVGTYSWADREVGDNETNPFPSFISEAQVNSPNGTGHKINQTFFHRNRLGFLCEDNIILSRASEPGNFFQESALVVGGSDPIDIQASSTQPTKLKTCIETNTGLVVFAESQQFLLHTDSDTLTPETGKVSNISTYRYSPKTDPVSLGTTIAFLDSAGVNARFFEMFDVRREGEPSMVEQTKVAPRLLPNDLDIITNSRENNTIFFSKIGSADVYGYRYFNTGEKRVQSAWFKWTLPHNIGHLFVIDDELYIIQHVGNNCLKIPLLEIDSARTAVGDDIFGDNFAAGYSVHLDSSKVQTAGNFDGEHTTVNYDPVTHSPRTQQAAAIVLSTGEVYLEDRPHTNNASVRFTGNFAGKSVVVGLLFDFKVTLPRIYVKQKAADITTSDITASLTLQRLHFRFGPVGQVDIELKRVGKPSLEMQFDATPMDSYDADEVSFVSEKTQTVPVYERNKNCNIKLKSNHPGPAQLLSMTWEGDYTPMHHKRV